MNREIKFRCWNEKMKAMAQTCYCEIYKDGSWAAGPDTWPSDDNLTLMQFTGLTDKHGKEIYEGDIVKCIQFGIDDSFLPTKEIWEIVKAKVYWNEKFCGWFVDDNNPLGVFDEVEILGNIYESPSLLTHTPSNK